MSLAVDERRTGWEPRRIGRRIEVLSEVPSTNSYCLEHADDPDADGLAVLADVQTAGRGRLGRRWLAPRGAAVLCSVLLTEAGTAGETGEAAGMGGYLTLAAAVAACEAIREATTITASIKWPNDLRVDGRKLGGILIESRRVKPSATAWVIGIGINCYQHQGHFPPELAGAATSLDLVSAEPVDRAEVARWLLRRLDAWLCGGEERAAEVRAAWSTFAEPLGQYVRLRQGGRETAGYTLDVDPHGGLVVQHQDGRREWFDPCLTSML